MNANCCVKSVPQPDSSFKCCPRLLRLGSNAYRRIVDFKLNGKTPDPEMVTHMHGAQLTAYSILYRDATGRTEGGLELHHLVRTKATKCIITSMPPATEQQVTRLFQAMESYQEGVARQDFVPSPGFACLGCEFINECKRWCP
jgi:putative RecB family exonuclease